jgi:hypothetical protein
MRVYAVFIDIEKNWLGKDPEEGRDASGEKVCSRFLRERPYMCVCGGEE